MRDGEVPREDDASARRVLLGAKQPRRICALSLDDPSPGPSDRALLQLLRINEDRTDLIRVGAAFADAGARADASSIYPAALNRRALEDYVAELPDQRASIYPI